MKKLSALFLTGSAYISLVFPVFANNHPTATVTPVPSPISPCPSGFKSLCDLQIQNILGPVITLIFVVAVLIALGFLIFGGIRWITSGGDKTGVETARNTIVAALVGLVVVFLAYFILDLLLFFFTKQHLNQLTLPTL